MKEICKFHLVNPDQNGVMNCPDCNTCDVCRETSYERELEPEDYIEPWECRNCRDNQIERVLHLTLIKKWFEEIKSGRKKEEYREIKPYWFNRLVGKNYTHILFRNGYSKNSPTILIQYLGLGEDRIFDGKPCFNLMLGNIINFKN